MSRRTLLALLAVAASLLAAAPAFAKAHKASGPTIKSIRPMNAKIGQRLTIRGSGFVTGKKKNTVVFMGAGKRVVWVKADRASSKTITVTLSDSLAAILKTSGGALEATKLQVRVISKKSGRAFTKLSKSPLIGPKNGAGPGGGSGCTPHTSSPSADSDGDGLPDQLEVSLPHALDPCKYDTDGDGVSDGFEYQSALDLNRTAGTSSIPFPFPGKKPYPNPLDPSDANTDFDGDGLTLLEEYQGSKFLGYTNLSQIHYSDGKQMTVPTPAPSADGYLDNGTFGPSGTDVPMNHLDTNGDGMLSDDEQDADGDGIGNWKELHGQGTQRYWDAWDGKQKPPEHPYTLRPFGVLNWLDADTDGDGIVDGADDQDNDGISNMAELSRYFVFYTGSGADRALAVNPFNPCLPNPSSPSCTKYVPFDGAVPTPFEETSPPLPSAAFPDFPAPFSWPSSWS